MKVNLTVGDLRNSTSYGDPDNCPVATAIKRVSPSFSPFVGVSIVYNLKDNKPLKLSPPYRAIDYEKDYPLRDDPDTPDSEIVRTFNITEIPNGKRI